MPRSKSRKTMTKAEVKSVAEVIDVGNFDPETPVKTGEGFDQRLDHTPLSSCYSPGSKDILVYESRTVRRSARLASKSSMGQVAIEVKVSGRKRKCFNTGDKEDCIEFDLELTERNGCSSGGKGSLIVEAEKDVVASQVHGEVGGIGSFADSGAVECTGEKVLIINNGKRKRDLDTEVDPVQIATEKKLLTLRSGKKIETTDMKNKSGQSTKNAEYNLENICFSELGRESNGWTDNALVKDSDSKQIENGSFERTDDYNVDEKVKREVAKNVYPDSALTSSKSCQEIERADGITQTGSTKRTDKGKEKLVIDEKEVDTKAVSMISTSTIPGNYNKGKGKLVIDEKEVDTKAVSMISTSTIPGNGNKGKEKLVIDEKEIDTKAVSMISTSTIPGNDNKGKGKLSIDDVKKETVGRSIVVPGNRLQASDDPKRITGSSSSQNRGIRERFRDIAKRSASRFAHFPSLEEEDNDIPDGLEGEPKVVSNETEEWPGPFSTAMRIIKDREEKANMLQRLLKSDSTPIVWKPKKDLKSNIRKNLAPSLVDICLYSIAENADAVNSLDYVPDALRHKISDLLCVSRKIDEHFLGLLVHGTPTEIHVRECSWIKEDIFTKTFSGVDLSNLTVLQLDQCGSSLPDYILSSTLAHSPNCLPSLTSLSLVGAYRLSDAGLTLLAAAAPALRSINLSQCSLITSDAIQCLASAVGSVLMELYIDECQGIDAMIILPALLRFENLEVLSMTNIGSVSDKFINEFVPVRGHNLKELVLRNCINLTDSSMRMIAEYCPKLCAIDLSNLSKLTDSALEYLANSCLSIHTLKFCRNGFSDEAVAAYIETCGEPLREVSLSNVSTVAHNTATSLAKHSKNLHSLDLSWCRKLTDEAFGLIVDSCTTLKMLKVFGCTQITNAFLDGHSNPEVQIIGLKMTPLLKHLSLPEYLRGPLRHSFITST